MKVLVVSQYYYPETFSITPLCEGLVRRGADVTVITGYPQYGMKSTSPKNQFQSKEVRHGVNIIRLNTRGRGKGFGSRLLHYFSFYRRSIRFLNNHHRDYDVVLGMSLSPLMSVAGAIKYARRHGIKSVLYCVDLWPESLVATKVMNKNNLLFSWINRWSQKIYQGFDRILIGSESFYDYLTIHHQLTSIDSHIVRQPTLPISKDAKSNLWGEGFHLLYTGHYGRGHNLTGLVSILHHFPHVKLHVVGHGETLPQLNHPQVFIYDAVPSDQLGAYYANADVCVVTLDLLGPVGETIPHKFLQYYQVGKPVLAFLRGEGIKHIHASQGGWALTPNISLEALKDTIEKIVHSTPEVLQKMGGNNAHYFKMHFHPDLSISYVFDTLMELSQREKDASSS